jgi:hypothetical protein
MPPWKLALQAKAAAAKETVEAPTAGKKTVVVKTPAKTVATKPSAKSDRERVRQRSQMTRGLAKAYKFVEQGAQKDPFPADFFQSLQAVVHERVVLQELDDALAHFESNKPLSLEDLMRRSSKWSEAPRWVALLEKQYDVKIAAEARHGARVEGNNKALEERAQYAKLTKGKARQAREKAQRRAAAGSGALVKPREPDPAVR